MNRTPPPMASSLKSQKPESYFHMPSVSRWLCLLCFWKIIVDLGGGVEGPQLTLSVLGLMERVCPPILFLSFFFSPA